MLFYSSEIFNSYTSLSFYSRLVGLSQLPQGNEPVPEVFRPSPFFTEQLTAFEVWLEFGSETKKPPEQLPVVLQVRLYTAHPSCATVFFYYCFFSFFFCVQSIIGYSFFFFFNIDCQ